MIIFTMVFFNEFWNYSVVESDEVEVESSAQFLVGRFLKSITETIRDDRAEGIII